MNDDHKALIRKLAKEYTVAQMARMLKISQSRIWRYCRDQDITTTRKLPTDSREIKRMVKKLGSVEKAAWHYSVTRQAIYYRLAKERK